MSQTSTELPSRRQRSHHTKISRDLTVHDFLEKLQRVRSSIKRNFQLSVISIMLPAFIQRVVSAASAM
jgi:hypothetical protein